MPYNKSVITICTVHLPKQREEPGRVTIYSGGITLEVHASSAVVNGISWLLTEVHLFYRNS